MRREEHGEGTPEELENCIANLLRPKGETTFVEATFVKHSETPEEKQLVLRRLLTRDYGTTSTSICESTLHLDGSELSKEDEAAVLEELVSSVPPLLMQQTLRSFVQGPPSNRRHFFERILSLNDLTDLISRAVIGNAKLPEFTSAQGSHALSQWHTLIGQLKIPEATTTAQKVRSVTETKQPKALADALIHVAGLEFTIPVADLAEVEDRVNQQQNEARQNSFPPLVELRPRQQPNHDLSTILAGFELRKAHIEATWKDYESARTLTNTVRANVLVIVDALETMIHTGLIDREQAVQL